MRALIVFLTGMLFGLGIVVSGMSNPAKVINFFDIAGTWDPSLVFVLFSAMLTAMVGYRFVLRRSAPVFDREFFLPASQTIDRSLIGGSLLFGVGWGIAGFCPGGAIPALGFGRMEPVIFVAAMIVGIVIARTSRDYFLKSRRAVA